MPAKTHTMHGRDHCPGGADPIPCLPPGLGGSTVDYGDYVTSLGPIAYWKLGETGSPWADTSGHAGGPRNLTIQGTGTTATLTPDVTGALPVGQDDGAVRLNFTGGGVGSNANAGQYLRSPTEISYWSLVDMTVTAFVKTVASTNPGRGHVVGNQAWAVSGGGYRVGWSLWTNTANQMVFGRGQVGGGGSEPLAVSPGPLIHGDWYHVAATYDGADMKLYLNGTLVDTEPEPSSAPAGTTGEVSVGYITGNFTHEWFAGTVDEVAIWDVALTPDELAALASVVVDADAVAAGKVLTSDGTGGSSWEYVSTGGIVDGAVTPVKVEPGTDGYTMQTVAGLVAWAPPTLRVNY